MENNSLIEAMRNARLRYKALQIQDEIEDYDNYDTTIERLEARGFIDGLEAGIMGGFDYAIYLLMNEEFHEHAQILRAQRNSIEASLNGGE